VDLVVDGRKTVRRNQSLLVLALLFAVTRQALGDEVPAGKRLSRATGVVIEPVLMNRQVRE